MSAVAGSGGSTTANANASTLKAVLLGVASLSFGAYAYFKSQKSKAARSILFGGVECGGTTFQVSIAAGDPTNIIKRETIPTTTPDQTLKRVFQL